MINQNRNFSENEWAILEKVWDLEPCTAPAIQEALEDEKGWAYTTVKTMMDRMVKKELLEAEKIRTLYFYRAAVTRIQASKSEISKTLSRVFDGALTPMMQFLITNEEISDAELNDIERMIRQHKRVRKNVKKKR
jgi:BlaI family penicillinase repressor